LCDWSLTQIQFSRTRHKTSHPRDAKLQFKVFVEIASSKQHLSRGFPIQPSRCMTSWRLPFISQEQKLYQLEVYQCLSLARSSTTLLSSSSRTTNGRRTFHLCKKFKKLLVLVDTGCGARCKPVLLPSLREFIKTVLTAENDGHLLNTCGVNGHTQ
jgi:hypothetical protein